jgi:hypothetical protein
MYFSDYFKKNSQNSQNGLGYKATKKEILVSYHNKGLVLPTQHICLFQDTSSYSLVKLMPTPLHPHQIPTPGNIAAPMVEGKGTQ